MQECSSNHFSRAVAASVILTAIVGLVSGAAGAYVYTSYWPSRPTEIMSSAQVERQIVKMVEDETATVAVVERVTPAVVSVVIKKPKSRTGLRVSPFDFSNPFFFFNNLPQQPEPEVSDEVVGEDELVEVGGGTGFFVREDGLIVTNKHVVADERASYFIVTNAGEEFPVEVIARDVFLDVALVKVQVDQEAVEGAPARTFPIVQLGNSDELHLAQTVIAIGNALSEFRNTVTKGVISGVDRKITAGSVSQSSVIERAIQTDAAINPGNSGGPLMTLKGEVVGINTAISTDGRSVGFAIPINDVKKIIESVEQFGRIVRPWLGVRYVVLNKEIAKENDLLRSQGAWIKGSQSQAAVIENSPAAKAGLKDGDIILKIGAREVNESDTLAHIIGAHNPGDVVELEVLRGPETLKISVTLEELNAEKVK